MSDEIRPDCEALIAENTALQERVVLLEKQVAAFCPVCGGSGIAATSGSLTAAGGKTETYLCYHGLPGSFG